MQLIINFIPWPKIQQKTPDKNPTKIHGKNLLKIPCDKNLFGSAKNFCEYFNIKILNNTKNFLILLNKQKTFMTNDLFETPELIPGNVLDIISKYEALDSLTYVTIEMMLKQLNKIGYTFEYYLDCIPYNLQKTHL